MEMPGNRRCHAISSDVETVLHGGIENLSRCGCWRRAIQFSIPTVRKREGVLRMRPMENEKPDSTTVHVIKRRRNRLRVSRTRVIMGLLLIVALAVFVILANKVVQENAEAIRQSFGR
jgi:hypothetical protein